MNLSGQYPNMPVVPFNQGQVSLDPHVPGGLKMRLKAEHPKIEHQCHYTCQEILLENKFILIFLTQKFLLTQH